MVRCIVTFYPGSTHSGVCVSAICAKFDKASVCAIDVARIFDLGSSPNGISHAMTTLKIFENRDFLLGIDILKWKITSRGLVWHVTKILLKRGGLEPKAKNIFPKMCKLREVMSLLLLLRIFIFLSPDSVRR